MVGEVMEEVRRVWRKVAVVNHVNSFLQLRVVFIVLPRVVANGGCVRVCGEEMYRRVIETEGGRKQREVSTGDIQVSTESSLTPPSLACQLRLRSFQR